MKILIATDSYLPRLGGAEMYAYKLASHLKSDGHEINLLTTEPGEWTHDHEFPVFRRAFSKNPFVFFPSLILYFNLIRKSDVVHTVYSHKLAAIGGLFSRLLGKKMIISEQGRGILDLPDNSFFYSKVHELYRAVAIKSSNLFIASCLEFVEIAKRYTSNKKIVYQPNSVDTEEFSPSEKDYSLLPFTYENQPLVFIVRRMVPKNGVQFLVEAAPFVLKDYPNVQFVHIGWGMLDGYLKKRVRELGIQKNFHFLGKIENENLKSYLNLADVVVFPSTAEATSIACLEAMSLEKPIVASRVGGFPEMVTDDWNGYLVNLTDTEHSNYDAAMTLSDDKLSKLANAVISIVNDSEKRQLFGERSRARAIEKFSWKHNIKKIINWYSQF